MNGWEGENFQDKASGTNFTQKESIDNEEIFSLVVMLKSIKTLLSIVAHNDYEIL